MACKSPLKGINQSGKSTSTTLAPLGFQLIDHQQSIAASMSEIVAGKTLRGKPMRAPLSAVGLAASW